jgi:hypothetical protein
MIYTCVKYQGKPSLNYQYTLEEMKNKKVKQFLSGGWIPVEEGKVNGEGEGEQIW